MTPRFQPQYMTGEPWQAVRDVVHRQGWAVASEPARMVALQERLDRIVAACVEMKAAPVQSMQHVPAEALELLRELQDVLGRVRVTPAAKRVLQEGLKRSYPVKTPPPDHGTDGEPAELYALTGPDTALLRTEPGRRFPHVVSADELCNRLKTSCAAALGVAETGGRPPRAYLTNMVFALAGVFSEHERPTATEGGRFARFVDAVSYALPFDVPEDMGRQIKTGVQEWRALSGHR